MKTQSNTPAMIWPFVGILAALACYSSRCAFADSATDAGPAVVHHLSSEQYRQTIADIFGPTIEIGGRFAPGVREDGLLEVGAGRASITSSSLEQLDLMARSIATQVVDPRHRLTLLPCQPAATDRADDKCTAQFVQNVGSLLYRRPLTGKEISDQVRVAGTAANEVHDFYAGIRTSLESMLLSPHFLFRKEIAIAQGQQAGAWRLDAYSKASRLSFMLWNAPPDGELLAAAHDGTLDSKSGLAHQVDRLLNSVRFTEGVRAFFADMLQLDIFQTLAKDPKIYPQYTPDISRDAAEQTLRTITDILVTKGGDYRDLYTTRDTFLTPVLASIYDVPIANPDRGWQPYTFPKDDPRVGILSHISFTALHSHPGRSSPTIRGRALREIFLCQKVPDPPGNVVFALVQDTTNPMYRTARARLAAHAKEPACAGCHKMTDPIGLGFEQFDSSGMFRTSENGSVIDVKGELNNEQFDGVAGIGRALHNDPALPACLVRRLYAYGLGRPESRGETKFLQSLTTEFAEQKYNFKKLVRQLVTAPEFYRVAPPETVVRSSTETTLAESKGE